MRYNPLRNIVLKVSAVALALLLWVHVATNKTYEYQLNLPLKVVRVPKGLVLVSEVPSIAATKVRATGKQLLLLSNSDPVIKISAADGKAGSVEKVIGASDLAEALGRSVENAEVLFPRSLTLKFEKEMEKRLAIRLGIMTEAGPGFALASAPRIDPESVIVSGPASVMRQLTRLETVSESLMGLIETTTMRIGLVVPESLHLRMADSTVSVRVEVEKARQKTFTNLSIVPPEGFPSGQYDIVPSHLTLVVNMPQSKYDFVSSGSIATSFSQPLLAGDTIRAAVEYTLPWGATIVGARVDSVTLIRRQ